ncbi:Holliday junction branch migration protein RuvA [Gleimia hominis]|uniref:Holliday junction branch migration protein RuvA n=1 Tax=Gleimia hominis TaxID=595468 RepID=UPI000C7F7F11|nr:Holliday junction branch migration protein RuvA [Gleimia hominis]WIK65117.1 Holliday junction branch migration protein RuvA [Gleimia hominis]
MIAYVSGEVLSVGADHAVVVLKSGFGVKVMVTARTLSELRIGQHCELLTSMVVREDAISLFGFLTQDERDTYEVLQTVRGVGPRLALACMEALTPDELREALAQGDEKKLQKIPGVGKKSAQRMILDIADKLGPVKHTAATAQPTQVNEDVVQALVGLGWSTSVAHAAVEQVAESGLTTEQMVRAALVNLGGHRG